MPELPEVERAARLLNEIGAGKEVAKVETTDDTIVYSGTSHTEFARALVGRKMICAQRYGKVFYMELEGDGRHPVMHFGMTGMLHVKGLPPTHYKEAPSDVQDSKWPPRWMKFILHFFDPSSGQTIEVAFRDARRLGRIRLCDSPREEPPISELGFDPILSMPPLREFSQLIARRKGAAIKALLLDQSFSAGVGNWVADEVLYHARIHPEQRCNTLSQEQQIALHEKMVYVCKTAIDVNADDSQFPKDWLFKHRWNKGKKKSEVILSLPSGKPATIKWITVGGRTSAYVSELQKPCPLGVKTSAEDRVGTSQPQGAEASDAPGRKRKVEDEGEEVAFASHPRKSVRRSARSSVKK